ncbi:phosphoadenosine phosphosulfate reductase family protein, partial [Dysgonomonas mossii]
MRKNKDIITWWSGGVTSAVTCKLCIDLYGKDRVRIIFIDTKNEHDDTYRFLRDCEKWYGVSIETISSQFESIEGVWRTYLSLNTAHGAICSTILKRRVREDWQTNNTWTYQAFGFDLKEAHRAVSMTINNPKVKAIYPLLLYGLLKKDCVKILEDAGIVLPVPYLNGYENNNC